MWSSKFTILPWLNTVINTFKSNDLNQIQKDEKLYRTANLTK